MPTMPPAHPCNPKKEIEPYIDHWQMSGQVCRFKPTTPIWHRILCVLGYHRWEERHDLRPEHLGRMRDQCGRCTILR